MSDSGSSPHTRGTLPNGLLRYLLPRFIPAYAGNTASVPPGCSCSAVHPRIRGEHDSDPDRQPARGGSSPHTRGTPLGRCKDSQQKRFIPAYAGNTARRHACAVNRAVHPRIRGEHGHFVESAHFEAGSSPHTRGTPDPSRRTLPEVRFIPAYAGNTTAETSPGRAPAVHPRIRGEHTLSWERQAREIGSSPHTRGTRAGDHAVGDVGRFIPAYAGNTS